MKPLDEAYEEIAGLLARTRTALTRNDWKAAAVALNAALVVKKAYWDRLREYPGFAALDHAFNTTIEETAKALGGPCPNG